MKDVPSTRPYLIRAMHQWCEDNGFTAYLAVAVDASVRVPRQHVVDGEIVLNASLDATAGLVLGNDHIEFKARFGGIPQSISIPVGRVHAIYARENGQGMAFPLEETLVEASGGASVDAASGQVTQSDAPGVLSLVGQAPPVEAESPKGTGDPNDPDPPSPPTGKTSRPTLTRIK